MYYNLFIYFNIIIIFPINFVPLLRMYNNVYSNGFVLGWDILIRSDPCTLYLTSGLYSSSFPLWKKNSLQSLTQKCSPDMPAGLAVLAQSLFTVSSTYIFTNLCDMASVTHSFLSFLWHYCFVERLANIGLLKPIKGSGSLFHQATNLEYIFQMVLEGNCI